MILIIDKSRRRASSTADIFRYMGLLARAETPDKALSEVSLLYRAILITSPSLLADPRDYVKRIRSYASDVPIFALDDGLHEACELFDAVFPEERATAQIYQAIAEYCSERDLIPPGEYMLAGINANVTRRHVTFFSRPILFTKTEARVLRLLTRTYPSFCSAKEILKYAFSQSKAPDVTGVRTHISSINKKFRESEGRPLIICKDGVGYVILTPVLRKELIANGMEDLVSAAK